MCMDLPFLHETSLLTKSISPYYFTVRKRTSAPFCRANSCSTVRLSVCLSSAICYHWHATLLTLQSQGCNSLVDKPRLTALQYIYILNISYIWHLIFKTDTNDTRMLTNYTWRHCKTLCSRMRLKLHAHTAILSPQSFTVLPTATTFSWTTLPSLLYNIFFSSTFRNCTQLQVPANNNITTLIQCYILVFSRT